ncbi:conserved Plasmodium protein, unknown function [Plasmodium malariae]|uniref:Uncharacterized protein n=1 Tax=Plasmodium malariae TaxID=5858 RepID=A0A1C3KB64_PLAMA|nr:conserved Plasmodium protein, unknown function [Plasmodium malariae]
MKLSIIFFIFLLIFVINFLKCENVNNKNMNKKDGANTKKGEQKNQKTGKSEGKEKNRKGKKVEEAKNNYEKASKNIEVNRSIDEAKKNVEVNKSIDEEEKKKEKVNKGKEEQVMRKEEVNIVRDEIKRCEEEKNTILEEIKNVQKSFDDYTTKSNNDLNACIAQMKASQNELNLCKENENKINGIVKDMSNKYNESLNKKEKDAFELKEKISNLENKIVHVESKLNTCTKNSNNFYKNKYNKDDNYLISYDIMISYFLKIFKIYKTFYIIIAEKTFMQKVLFQMVYWKDVIIKNVQEYGLLVISQLYLYGKGITHSNFANRSKTFYQNSPLELYVTLVKDKIVYFALSTKTFCMKYINYIIPQLLSFKKNAVNNLDVFVQKLHDNSHILVNKLNTINPELKGIIPTDLSDQIILLIFFTLVNVIHLYILFYVLFLLYNFIKRVLVFLFTWICFIFSIIYEFTIFVLTLPVRPCMPRKNSKNRKTYKKHDEQMYSNPERVSYQQQEFKKMYKNQNVHQRKF